MKLVKEFITKLSNQLNNWLGSKILDYKIIVQVDATLELRLLVFNEIEEEELFSIDDFKSYENIILISQVTQKEFGANEYNNNETKIYYNHRRRFSRLIKPNNNIFSETEKETLPPIITFYSYKGGLGRTTTLACFAAYMAMTKNKKVVIVDCDFEAPGFSNGNYFFLDTQKEVCGVVEYLLDKEFKAHLGEKIEKEDFKKEYAYTVDSSFTKGSNGQGEIYIIPSGNTRKQDTYLESLARIDLGYDLKGFIEDIQTIFELTPENGLILFDSRTGFNDTFAALAEVSNTIVGLFGVNQQNEAGIEFFVKHFQNNIDKNVFFIKGLTDKAKKEEKRLKELIDKYELTIENGENEINLKPYISHVLRIPLLQDLGVLEVKEDKNGREILSPLIDEDDFKDFLISIEKEKDVANMSSFFPEIAKSIEKKKSKTPQIVSENIQIQELAPIIPIPNTLSIEQKIKQWQQDTSIERMFQLKYSFLTTIKSPISRAERESNLQELSDKFYFRAIMRDIFNKDKFIIVGGKGSGKTYWYRLLEEKYPQNEKVLDDLCKLEKKKREKYIFVNVIDDNPPKIDSITNLRPIDTLKEQDFKSFWLLLVHYAVCNHTSIKKFFISTIIDTNLTFNQWVQKYLQNNTFNSVVAENELQELNKKLKELDKELIISFDYLDQVIQTKYWKISTSQLLRFWDKNPDFSHIKPKIFIRADLFNAEKIEMNNFLGVKTYATINLIWSKDELFAYFFTTVLKPQASRNLFYHYLVCLQKNNRIYNAQSIIFNIEKQFTSQVQQLAPFKDEMEQLATIFFDERADFLGNNDFKYPTSYDWFVDNLRDALKQTSLRAFWELIILSVKGGDIDASSKQTKENSEIYFKENYDNIVAKWQDTKVRIENENKKREKKLVVKSQPRIPTAYPLIEPRFYTWKGHREEAAKQFLEELKSEEGNAALTELIDFFTRVLQLSERKYNYLHKEFENLMQRFLQREFARGSENIKKIASNEKDSKEVILWLVNNGIIEKVITDYGDNTKYIFPYLYRSLFSLNVK